MKPLKNKNGFVTITVLLLSFVILIAVVAFFVWSHQQNRHDAQAKIALDQQVAQIKPPDSCTETNKVYTAPDLDNVSSWEVTYSCKNSPSDVYKSLKQKTTINSQSIYMNSKGYDHVSYNNKDGSLDDGQVVLIQNGYREEYLITNLENTSQSGPTYTLNLAKYVPIKK